MSFDASFWVAISFVAFVVLLWKPAKKAIGEALDARAAQIARDIAQAEALKAEAEKLLAEYRAKHQNAMKEAEGIVAQAKADAERAAKIAAAEFEESLKRREERALVKIAKAEAAAKAEVRDAAVEAAIAATQDLLVRKLDAGAKARLVDKAVADMARRLN